MVDPRTEPPQDDGTHPPRPGRGGPQPDPRSKHAQPRSRENKILLGFAIAFGIIAIILAGILLAPSMDVVEDAELSNGGAGLAPTAMEGGAGEGAAKPGDCRDFAETLTVAGEDRQVTGTACMQDDGSWKIVEKAE